MSAAARLCVILLIAILAGEAASQDADRYTCPMHPHYISSEPGSCPICGMDLVAFAAKVAAPWGGVAVAPEMIQTMGIRTAPAEQVSFGRTVRAFGEVAPSTRRESVAASRVEGWIEELAVTAVGDAVESGSLLYRVYSPDLIAAQQDFLAAARSGVSGRLESMARRLQSLGMQDSVIAALLERGRLMESVPVHAEAGGVVADLSVRAGSYVKPGAVLIRIQDYSTVWVNVDIAEKDLPMIGLADEAQIMVPAAGDALISGTVNYVYPTVDSRTRTGKVRIVADNRAGLLRPGAFADVTFTIDDRPRLSVPSEAVLRDSRGGHVIMALGDGRFAPRTVQTGVTAVGRTEVLGGLADGERVVVSGQFLLDSEASLRESFAKFSGDFGPDTPLSELPIDADALAEIDHLVDAALYLHEALVDGYRIDRYFLDPALQLGEAAKARFAGSLLVPIIEEAQAALRAAQADDGVAAQEAALAQLTAALEPWLLGGAPIRYRDLGLVLFAESESGRLWVQEGPSAANPYGSAAAMAVPWPDPMASQEILHPITQ